MRLAEHEKLIRERLTKAGVDSPGLCARLLVAHAAGLDRLGCLLAADRELPGAAAEKLEQLCLRRQKGEPMAYLLGKKAFYKLEFAVNPHTLIPRPETEMLVEKSLELLPAQDVRFVDAGCGSGCIGISLLAERPRWQGILLEKSLPALAAAMLNDRNLGAGACFVAADMFALPFAPASLDLIVSNPPYIGREELAQVMPEVLAYEPRGALFSQNGGLAHLLALVEQAARLLRPNGWIVLEHGASQGPALTGALVAAGFADVCDYADLAGLPRCAAARKPQGQ